MAIIVMYMDNLCTIILLEFFRGNHGDVLQRISDRTIQRKKKIHLMHLPMNMESVYHLWLPLSLEYLHLKVRFLTMEVEMDAEAMELRCE